MANAIQTAKDLLKRFSVSPSSVLGLIPPVQAYRSYQQVRQQAPRWTTKIFQTLGNASKAVTPVGGFKAGIQRVQQSPLKQYFLPTSLTTPQTQQSLAVGGKVLQLAPSTQINLPEQKIGKFTLPTDYARRATQFASSLPGEMLRGYGRTAEMIATPQGRQSIGLGLKALPGQIRKGQVLSALQNPAVQAGLDVSDFIPGIGLIGIGGGVKALGREEAEKLAKEGTERLAREGGEKRLEKDTLNILSRLKNTADNSGSLSAFKRFVNNSQEALGALKEAGFRNLDDYWKYTHESFQRADKLLSESLAQTKFRREAAAKSSIQNSVEFVKDIKREFKASDGAFKPLTPKEKVNIWDYIRTPDRILKKIGMADEAKMLRNSWEKYLDELPQEIEKVTEWSKRVPRPESNRMIFKYLDGQITSKALDDEELRVANEIKVYLSEWADRLKLPIESRITNYITRIWENDVTGKEFPEEIASLIRDKVAGQVYDPFVTKRLGVKGYAEDTWAALDAYVKRATRKVNMDDTLAVVKRRAEGLEDSQFNYIKSYVDRINLRPTDIDNLVDNWIKSTPVGYRFTGRPLANITRKARQAVYRGLLGLNPASALKNLSQGANTYAELGEKYTIVGYAKVIRDLPSSIIGRPTELERVGVLKNGFIEDRVLNATKKFWEKTDSVLFYMFNLAEKINRGAAYYGAKARALNEGKTYAEAVEAGKELVRKTQFTFGAIDTPVAMQSDLVKTFTQFMTYTIKQGEFLGEKIGKKEIAGLVRYIGAQLLFIATIGKAFGMEWKDIIPTIRLGVPPTLQAPYGALQVAMGTKDKYGNEPDQNLFKRTLENKNLIKGITSYFPAGGQILKTAGGLRDYFRGESRTPSGNVRYPVKQTFSNLIKGGLFGTYSTAEGQAYIKNLGISKSEILYKELKKLPPEQAVARVKQLKAQNPAGYRAFMEYVNDRTLEISSREKQIRNLAVKDGSRSKAIVRQFNSLKTPEEKATLWKRYLQAGIITEEIQKQLMAAKQAGVLK